jgi:hypothetical protein
MMIVEYLTLLPPLSFDYSVNYGNVLADLSLLKLFELPTLDQQSRSLIHTAQRPFS